ncbi:MAG: sulfatase-like hydrolase/transferase [Elusimicrobia bacterium]|nr:sulfatase-like hydrolase/transferase [Elusimicrobiota bacterium]
MKRRIGSLLCCGLLAATARPRPAAGSPPTAIPEPLHILFIVLDAARTDHLSCCGYPKPTTPRLDELARRGAVFLNCFSPAARTDASVSRILSSRHLSIPVVPSDGFAFGSWRETPQTLLRRRDAGQVFLPELLGQNGYRTALFTSHPWIVENSRLARMFWGRFYRVKTADRDEALLSQVAQWLRAARIKPAFAYIHLLCPHAPYPVRAEQKELLPGVPPEEMERISLKIERHRSTEAAGWGAEDLARLTGLYDANLKYADRQIGALLDRVREEGLEDRTLVVITADHAENLGDHRQILHGGPHWDSVTRVPLILALPGVVPAGLVVKDDVSSLDIVPTLIELSGAKVPPGKTFDGESLLPRIREERPVRPFVLGEEYLREGGIKYISAPEHLADVRKDPGETRDLSAADPALLARMRARHAELLEPYLQRARKAVRAGPPAYPFYFPMQAFSPSPASAVAQVKGGESSRLRDRADACWLLRHTGQDSILYRLPAFPGSVPLELSAPLPNGVYQVSALIQCLGPESGGADSFEFRLSSGTAFRRCPVHKSHRGGKPSLSDDSVPSDCPLGPVTVSDGVFRLAARGKPAAGAVCGIYHILFDPPRTSPGPRGVYEFDRTEELRRQMRKAGYW